jgi:hypothetical protein
MAAGAQDVLVGNTLAKTLWLPDAYPLPAYVNTYSITAPGSQAIMGVTTTDSADHYGIFSAALQNAAGKFVAPDTAGLLAGEAAMRPVPGVPGVLQPDFTSQSKAAYPLAMLTYAAVPVGTVAKADCTAYAALLNYAAGPGQVPGIALGNLPRGYAPLPAALAAQTKAAASRICPQPTSPSGSTPPGQSPSTSGNPSGSGSPSSTGPSASASTPGASGRPGGSGSSGGPAGVKQGLQLVGGITPANPSVFGYALPVGAATGFLATMAAPLISRRRTLRLLRALRLPQLPQLPRQPRSPRPWRPWRGSP